MTVQSSAYSFPRLSLPGSVEQAREEILAVWKANLEIHEPGRFAWFYLENPCGRAITWLVRDQQRQAAIGLASLYPRLIQLNGREIRIASAIDIAIEKSRRVFGPALPLAREVAASHRALDFHMILAAPNRAALGIFQLARYHMLGAQKNWVRPVSYRALLERYLGRNPAAAMLGGMLDFFSRGRDRLDLRRRPPAGVCFEEATACDRGFEELWAEARTAGPISVVKNRAYLEWRYVRCRTMAHVFFCMRTPDGRLRGFVVYTRLPNKVAVVTDLVVAEVGLRTMLLSAFRRHLEKADVSHISLGFFGPKAFREELRRLGYKPRHTVRHCMVYADAQCPAEDRRVIHDPEQWLLFEGDLDL